MVDGSANPVTVALTGHLPLILSLAVVIALLVSIGLLQLYRRAVLRSMRTRINPPAPASVAVEASSPPATPIRRPLDLAIFDHGSSVTAGPAAEALYAAVRRAPWRAALIYVAAGSCYSLIFVAALLMAEKMELLPLRFLLLFWTYAWPIVLTINIVTAASQRVKLAAAAGYFLVLAFLGALSLTRSSMLTWSQIAILWFLADLPPTVTLWAFLNRRVRAVGPLVLTFMVLAVAGSDLALTAAGSEERLLRVVVTLGSAVGLDATGIFVGLVILGFVAFAVVGWQILLWIGRRYERKKISDQSIILDSMWLFFGVVYSIDLVFERPEWILSGLFAFLVYKASLWVGFSLLGGKTPPSGANPKLLLLRVFSLGKRTERLFGILATHWRYVGSILLIQGPDLAMTTIKPHEFLDFLRGRLTRLFIDGPKMFGLRTSEMDFNPDNDGRFRVNDFFCYDDTWKMVLTRLASESNAVLMDLRGFSRQNAGVIFEIKELINLVPLERVVIVTDGTTDDPFLRQTLNQAWMSMDPASPNRLPALGPLRLFQLSRSGSGELWQLLYALCLAATARPASTV